MAGIALNDGLAEKLHDDRIQYQWTMGLLHEEIGGSWRNECVVVGCSAIG